MLYIQITSRSKLLNCFPTQKIKYKFLPSQVNLWPVGSMLEKRLCLLLGLLWPTWRPIWMLLDFSDRMQNKDVACPYSNNLYLNIKDIRRGQKRHTKVKWCRSIIGSFRCLFEFVSLKAKCKQCVAFNNIHVFTLMTWRENTGGWI